MHRVAAARRRVPPCVRSYASTTPFRALAAEEEEILIGSPSSRTAQGLFPASQELHAFEALHFIRDLEASYGPIAEFKLKKDAYLPQKAATHLVVRFQNEESLRRIPTPFHMHRLSFPSAAVSSESGGIGLLDIVEPVDTEHSDAVYPVKSKEEVGTDRRFAELRLAPRDSFALVSQAPERQPNWKIPHHRACAHAFLAWKGFHSIKPINQGTSLKDTDHPKMRLAMRQLSERNNVKNPLELAEEELNRPEPAQEVSTTPVEAAPHGETSISDRPTHPILTSTATPPTSDSSPTHPPSSKFSASQQQGAQPRQTQALHQRAQRFTSVKDQLRAAATPGRSPQPHAERQAASNDVAAEDSPQPGQEANSASSEESTEQGSANRLKGLAGKWW